MKALIRINCWLAYFTTTALACGYVLSTLMQNKFYWPSVRSIVTAIFVFAFYIVLYDIDKKKYENTYP